MATQVAKAQESIKDYVLSVARSLGKATISVKKFTETLQNGENQERLAELIKEHMPEPKVKKARKPKDPNAPKRPLTAYFRFSRDKRDEVKAQFPSLKVTEIAKKLGEMWKTTEDKSQWENEARAEREERSASIEQKPKRAKSAYIFFCQEMRDGIRKEHPEFKMTDVTKELGRMWKNDYADEKKRAKWVELAKAEKERTTSKESVVPMEHESEAEAEDKSEPERNEPMLAVEPPLGRERSEPPLGRERSEPPKKKSKFELESDSDSEEDLSTKKSGMELFVSEMKDKLQKNNPKWTATKLSAELKKLWSSLSQEEKDDYNNRD